MKKYNIRISFIGVIKTNYNKATSAFLFNSRIGGWFRTTVRVRHGCLISPTLFKHISGKDRDTLEDHEGTVSIGGGTISNICFADDNDGLAGEEEELEN